MIRPGRPAVNYFLSRSGPADTGTGGHGDTGTGHASGHARMGEAVSRSLSRSLSLSLWSPFGRPPAAGGQFPNRTGTVVVTDE